MKSFTLVSLAAFIGIASAIMISPAPAPYFGPLGPAPALAFGGLLGLGAFGPLGPLGMLGPLGLGPLGGLGLGLGLGSFGPFGNARLGGIRGRRALDEKLRGIKKSHGDIKCELNSELLNCTGPHVIIQCRIEAYTKFPIDLGRFKVNDFTIREKVINKIESLKIVPKKHGHHMSHKLENLAFFDDIQLAKNESGFLVKDPACFNDVLSLVKEIPEKIKFTFGVTVTAN